MARVIIGMDPHKRSATIEVINDHEKVLAQGRFGTDTVGYQAMLSLGRQYKDHVWAVEGCNGIGRHIAQRLVADGETVIDVPAKLSARARVFATGQGRKTDPVDAHSVAVSALRTEGLRQVTVDDASVALRLLVDRRDRLGRTRTDIISRLHHLLLELVPGGAKKFLSALQARALLNTVRPRDVVGRTRRQLASELITELASVDRKIKAANAQLTELVEATGSRLQELNGIGPSGAARLIGDIGDIHRFASRGHFASWNGTAPIDTSSGDQQRHRLSRAGNRRINRSVHPASSRPSGCAMSRTVRRRICGRWARRCTRRPRAGHRSRGMNRLPRSARPSPRRHRNPADPGCSRLYWNTCWSRTRPYGSQRSGPGPRCAALRTATTPDSRASLLLGPPASPSRGVPPSPPASPSRGVPPSSPASSGSLVGTGRSP
ncbi:hypothetical protein GCM10009780_68940 [Actinomadura alba]|nr:IS110 family transposase [Actinomadura alba]